MNKNNILMGSLYLLFAIITFVFLKSWVYFLWANPIKVLNLFILGGGVLIVIVLCLTLISKFTSFSWVSSIDFVGEKTIDLGHKIILRIQSILDIDIAKNNQRTKTVINSRSDVKVQRLNPSVFKTDMDEPVIIPVPNVKSERSYLNQAVEPTEVSTPSVSIDKQENTSSLVDLSSLPLNESVEPDQTIKLSQSIEEVSAPQSLEEENDSTLSALDELLDLVDEKAIYQENSPSQIISETIIPVVEPIIDEPLSTSTAIIHDIFYPKEENEPVQPQDDLLVDEESSANIKNDVVSPPEPISLMDNSTYEKVGEPPSPLIPSVAKLRLYQLPSVELLEDRPQSTQAYSEEDLYELSRSVERVLNDYKISAVVVGAYPGPIITRFELDLAAGIKVSRVNGLAKDLARTLLVSSVRVVEIIDGTSYIGLEIPNKQREMVSFYEIMASEVFKQAKSKLTLGLGKDVSGQTVVTDLAKMPHLLVAGTTGSGKSVAINTMILSMLYKATPSELRMIMVDPKMLELSVYEDIPHLLTPVVTDMNEAQNALRWAVAEMERRYQLMSKLGVRNLAGFNHLIAEAAKQGRKITDPLYVMKNPTVVMEDLPTLMHLPHIVIVIDELADMMMIVGKKVEELIARLAQKARAAGIHLILATQRPSVDVLTGLIKANVPSRISFQVSSRIDSATIIGQGGAENLLGNGDMLFLPAGSGFPQRAHGAFVDDHEVHAVVEHLKSFGTAQYLTDVTKEPESEKIEEDEEEKDPLYGDAVDFVIESDKASISSVQRRFKIGYNRAANIIEQMERDNIVSEPEGNGSRRIIQDN